MWRAARGRGGLLGTGPFGSANRPQSAWIVPRRIGALIVPSGAASVLEPAIGAASIMPTESVHRARQLV